MTTSVGAYDFVDNGIYYTVLSESDKTCEVAYGDIYYSGNVNIPETANRNGSAYTVTAIGESAFYYCSGLESVTMPATIETIKPSAFASCAQITEVTIPNSVKEIYDYAFANCEQLANVDLGNSVEEIWWCAFMGCISLKSISLPESLREIGYDLFADCPNLASINVDEANPYLTSDDGVLYSKDMTKLIVCPKTRTTFTIPSTVTTIGNGAFDTSTLREVSIPNSVTTIESYAFHNCYFLTEISIPNSVRSIGGEAFSRTSLTEIHIPASVTEITEDAFVYCPYLQSITVDEAAPNNSSEDGILYDKNKTRLLTCPGAKTSATIPQTVTSIADYAFSEGSIERVTLPQSLTEIGERAFMYCERLTDIDIPNSAKEIKDEAFYACKRLKNIVIGSSVEHIGDAAFHSLEALQTVYSLNPEPPQLGVNPWTYNINSATLYVPQGSAASYRNALTWGNFGTILELDPAGIGDAQADGIVVSGSESGITVSGIAAGQPVRVYDEGGRLVHSAVAGGTAMAIPAAKGHIYIIKVGGKALKIVL